MASGAMAIEVPDVAPAKGGLLEVARAGGFLREESDPHLGAGVVYEGTLCGTPSLAPGLCDDALGLDPDTVKTFESPGAGESNAFAIYKGLVCSPGYGEYESRTRAFLERGESHGAELGFQALVLNGADVLPGGPVSTKMAIALAERIASEEMGGVGLISVSRYGASLLAGERVVNEDDGLLSTMQGLSIINGSGISDSNGAAQPSADAGFFIWVHAPVEVLRGPVIYSQGYGLETNTEVGLAERIFAVTDPCYIMAIEVDPSL